MIENKEYITIALSKGRLADLTVKKLIQSGIICGDTEENSRKLILTDYNKKIKLFLAKANDIPTYVEYGAADMGIVGKDIINEENRKVYELYDLGFGKCKIVVAGKADLSDKLYKSNSLRVATKYPEIAKDYFYNTKRRTVEIIRLNGSIELAPMVGLSDVIVDIVETGNTLKENGLIIKDEILSVSARLIVNSISIKTKFDRIKDLIEKLKEES